MDIYADGTIVHAADKETKIIEKKFQSKKISNDQELIQSEPIPCPKKKQKGNN